MRRINIDSHGFGPAIGRMAEGRVQVRVSYLLSQWVQAPIIDWREGDT